MPNFTNLDLRRDATAFIPWRPWWFRKCKPRILVVTDGGLNYRSNSGFGLSRFIEAIAHHSSSTLKPQVTLAHRNGHITPITIANVSYDVATGFNFANATPAVTLSHYDQVWLFGVSGSPISNAEVQVLSDFMNSGGGVFATGDHAALGSGMGARLPRIRHMREWNAVPMGLEALPLALERIDTVTNPGPDGAYQFEDQSDDIPQRIFPNYSVTGPGFGNWTATIHPVLRLPGAMATRDTSAANFATGSGLQHNSHFFSNDMDCLPDHPHESECYEVSTTTNANELNGTFNLAGLNFAEFPAKASGGGKVGSEILAFAVSGGRTVWNGAWKPPVRPRMFGAMSGFDGHLANPLPGKAARPGRIMCDATWHHFVNVNLDGIGSSRQGLGSWAGNVFSPSPALLKIYKYYQNMVSWLQPSNRVWCRYVIYVHHVLVRSDIAEEFFDIQGIKDPREVTALGLALASQIDREFGAGAAFELVRSGLNEVRGGQEIAQLLGTHEAKLSPDDAANIFGFTLGQIAKSIIPKMPLNVDEKFEESGRSEKLHEDLESIVQKKISSFAKEAVEIQMKAISDQSRRSRAALKRATD